MVRWPSVMGNWFQSFTFTIRVLCDTTCESQSLSMNLNNRIWYKQNSLCLFSSYSSHLIKSDEFMGIIHWHFSDNTVIFEWLRRYVEGYRHIYWWIRSLQNICIIVHQWWFWWIIMQTEWQTISQTASIFNEYASTDSVSRSWENSWKGSDGAVIVLSITSERGPCWDRNILMQQKCSNSMHYMWRCHTLSVVMTRDVSSNKELNTNLNIQTCSTASLWWWSRYHSPTSIIL